MNQMILGHSELLTPQIEADFKQFLAENYGLQIHSHQEDRFKLAICKTCQKFSWFKPEQLLIKLKADSLCPERLLLIENITVPESYFFRDENQQQFLKNVFFPNLIAQKRQQHDKHIRIWSAGCSTGQEIYSIAILLHQLLPDFSDWNLHLIASDINHQSLKDAIQGEYNSWEIRSNDPIFLQSGYFSDLKNGHYQLSESIKKQVKFFFLNLAEDSFPSLMNQTCNLDLILCRNVFIYFQRPVIEQTCTRFSQALKPGGVLLLSVTDPMDLSTPQLVSRQCEDVFYFERVEADSVCHYVPYHPNISTPQPESLVFLSKPNTQPESFSQIKASILPLLAAGKWHEILALTQHALLSYPDQPDLNQFKAKALVNLGLLDKAKLACELSIKADDLDPHSYLLYGLILLQLNLYDEAEKAFRQTIFLNYDFMEAHYQLGRVLLYKGQQKQAIKAIQNALNLAEQGDGQRPVHNVITLTYASFAELIKNELSVLDKGG
jgi:chemotaxis protein methyltransferase CheR